MIAYVKGIPAYTRADYAVIDVGGVGYKVFMPLSHLGRLPREEKVVTVYTYLHVREDIQALYGFLSTEDLDIFELLLAVSGVGPKAALSILSTLEPSKLALAVSQSDVKAISSAPGIGKKTAERIVLELKNKIGSGLVDVSDSADYLPGNADLFTDAVSALMGLGYTASEASEAARKAGDADSVEEIIKNSLKYLM
ncbi:MAG: Holliday junction branch migration protein RuvA [Clostridia bacterium]|nr:Holliday junction branch migration protein RuvA [Clostridia bacterium]